MPMLLIDYLENFVSRFAVGSVLNKATTLKVISLSPTVCDINDK